MPEYVGTQAGEPVALHTGLRVTFAETPTMLAPTMVETADLRDNIAHLVSAIEGGGFVLVPTSDVGVPPGATAWTIDFEPMSQGVTVGAAISQLEDGLYGPFDFLRRTYIRRVEKFGGQSWGDPIDQSVVSQPDQGLSFGGLVAGLGGTAVALGLAAGVVIFLPEIKALTARARN